jgi:hypothetical protein
MEVALSFSAEKFQVVPRSHSEREEQFHREVQRLAVQRKH